MKKIYIVSILTVLLCTALVGCSSTGSTTATTAAGATTAAAATTAAITTTAAETTIAAATSDMVGTGTLGDFAVTIKGFTLGKDYEGKPAVVITYEWTNNSKETTSFAIPLTEQVFQAGIECEMAIMSSSDNYNSDNYMKDIRPGATLEVQCAYVLNDTTSPIEVEVKESFSFADKPPMVTQKYDIAK